MTVFYPAILAGILALSITIAELVTSKYARTYFLVMRSQWIYVYALIYALIAFGVMLLVDTLTENGLIKLEGLGLSNIWVRAIVVGVSVKAFLHIRLFNVTVAHQTYQLVSKPSSWCSSLGFSISSPWIITT